MGETLPTVTEEKSKHGKLWHWFNEHLIECRWLAFGLAAFLISCGLYLGWAGYSCEWPQSIAFRSILNDTKIQQAVVWAFFTIGAPGWFAFEWFIFAEKESDPDLRKAEFEHFKYGQDLGAKFWLGVATVMLAVFFGKDLARTNTGNRSTPSAPTATADKSQTCH